jgi:hypothetical protein
MNESSPEKAGVGGSIPSLATTFSNTYRRSAPGFGPNSGPPIVFRDSSDLNRLLLRVFTRGGIHSDVLTSASHTLGQITSLAHHSDSSILGSRDVTTPFTMVSFAALPSVS